MDQISSPASAPFAGARVDALLREAARLFGVPVALLSPDAAGPANAAFASAAVTAADGKRLATLCLLAQPRPDHRAATTVHLHDLAARAAAAMQDGPGD